MVGGQPDRSGFVESGGKRSNRPLGVAHEVIEPARELVVVVLFDQFVGGRAVDRVGVDVFANAILAALRTVGIIATE